MYHSRILGITVLTLLSGCGSNSDTQTTDTNQLPTEVPAFSGISVSTAPLIKANTKQFTQHLKNGIFMRHHYSSYIEPVADGKESNSQSSNSFSQTNQQEQSVSEADRVKYNGDYLYIAANKFNDLTPDENISAPHYIRIMKRESNGTLQTVKDLTTSQSEYAKQQLFLAGSTLVSLNFSHGWFRITNNQFSSQVNNSSITPEWNHNQFEVNFADVATPEQASLTHQYTIDGQLVDSRIIDDQLYLISNFTPTFSGFELESNNTESELKNYQALYQADINTLMPNITNTQTNQTQALVDTDECYLSENTTNTDGYDAIMTITRISLSDPAQRSSVCVNTEIEGLYASQNAIYTYGTRYDGESINSVIHKFALDEQSPNYSATGKVTGHFGWNMQNLRFSEYNDQLRVVTSSGNETEGFDHRLRILKQQGNELITISELPNQSNPTPIGKVNEQSGIVDENIYAVRFAQDRAYIVTFRQIDPLYVIDLKDPSTPKIVGALEIPGYSAYLHPIGDNLLLGIGQQVSEVTIPEQPSITEGTKISLFDISDINTPKLLNSKTFSNAYTPAEQDYHAFSFLNTTPQQFRFSFPIEEWVQTGTDTTNYEWTRRNQLSLFEVNSQDKTLTHIGNSQIKYDLSESQRVPLNDASEDRAVLHDDNIYYIHGNYVWHSMWSQPEANTGPH